MDQARSTRSFYWVTCVASVVCVGVWMLGVGECYKANSYLSNFTSYLVSTFMQLCLYSWKCLWYMTNCGYLMLLHFIVCDHAYMSHIYLCVYNLWLTLLVGGVDWFAICMLSWFHLNWTIVLEYMYVVVCSLSLYSKLRGGMCNKPSSYLLGCVVKACVWLCRCWCVM